MTTSTDHMTNTTDLRVLRAQLDAAVEAAWPMGWQPVDIVRLAAEFGGPAATAPVVDALARTVGRHAQATVAPLWRDQLRSMGADPWANRRGDPVHVDGDREEVGHRGLLAALRGLKVVLLLAPEPVLCPPPGEYRDVGGNDNIEVDGGRPAGGCGHDPSLLAKVRALLAKAEATTFAPEAEAFTAKAQELMARYAIDEAMVRADEGRTERPQAAGVRIWIDAPYVRPKFRLLGAVARANGGRAVLDGAGFATVVGDPHGLEATEMLFTSLLLQATTAIEVLGRDAGRGAHVRSKRFRSSFFAGFATRIGARLMEAQHTARQSAEAAAGIDLLPVLASREEESERRLRELFPRLSTMRSNRAVDGEGWLAGASAADQCSLQPARSRIEPAG